MIDPFFTIKTLHKLGIKIHLHCFEYGRGEQPELRKYCEEIHYYPRETFSGGIPLRLPYIVSSRINPLLIKNIQKDNYPVLLEGIHCTYYLYHGELSNRKTAIRLMNVEYEYYRQLANSTNNFYKKIYFKLESSLLKKYEAGIARKGKLIALNEKDKHTYEEKFSAKKIAFIPAILPYDAVVSKPGAGKYCLYHGNLSVPENEKAVEWLLKNVFNNLNTRFIIAGKNPSTSLLNCIAEYSNAEIVADPTQEKINELVTLAHIHVLPSFNNTGIKIKLLYALFTGRFVITNRASLEGTGLESLCNIAETPEEYRKKIIQLFESSFTENEIEKRKEILEYQYNSEKNALKLMQMINE